MRGGEVPFDQFLERALAVPQRLGHVRVHFAGAVSCVEFRNVLERFDGLRKSGVECLHDLSLQSSAAYSKVATLDCRAGEYLEQPASPFQPHSRGAELECPRRSQPRSGTRVPPGRSQPRSGVRAPDNHSRGAALEPQTITAAERRKNVAPGASPGFSAVKRISPGGAKDFREILSPLRGLKSKTTPSPGLAPGATFLRRSAAVIVRGDRKSVV